MKKLVALTGAGISAESGIPTFRDAGGLWEGYDVNDVATPEAWERNPERVLDFYNQRRKKALEVEPNEGHRILADFEVFYDVTVITQNVDNLHERAGSSNVVHLHGSLFESRSSIDASLVYPINGWELKMGQLCEKGSQLRPNIVWFGEIVTMIERAMEISFEADIFLVVGTSLLVYPAASLVHYVRSGTPIYIVDPKSPNITLNPHITVINELGSVGLKKVREILTASQGISK
ncbi:MAG: NAD-dependent deacylase [Cyclobacteriaceae bacterium]